MIGTLVGEQRRCVHHIAQIESHAHPKDDPENEYQNQLVE
jgi:hypothetical protein